MSIGLIQPSGGIASYPITEVLSSTGEKGRSEVGEVRVLKVVSGDGS